MQRYFRITSRILSSSRSSLFILFLIEAIYLWLVLRGRIITFSDTDFPINPILALTRSFYYWNFPKFPGAEGYAGYFFYKLAIASFFELFGLRTSVLQYLSLLMVTFISSLGFFYLVKYFLEGSLATTTGTNRKTYENLSALVSGFFYSITPFYTYIFISDLADYIYVYTFYPLLLYFIFRYITNKNKLSLDLLYFTIVAILFSIGNPLEVAPALWWELVIGIVLLIALYFSKLYKIYFINIGIVLLILIILLLPFIPSYISFTNLEGYIVTHYVFAGKTFLEYNVGYTFSIMNLHNFSYLYYMLDRSFSLYKELGTYLLVIPAVTVLSSILVVKDNKALKFLSILMIIMFIIVGGSADVFNPIDIYNVFPSSVTAGIAYSFQYVFSLYPISFILTLLSGIGFYYALSRIKWRIVFDSLYVFTTLFIVISIILLPPVDTFSASNYPPVTSLVHVIPPLTNLSNFFVSHNGWYNVLFSPAQLPGYAYDGSTMLTTAASFGAMILPPSNELVAGSSGLAYPILVHFPSSNYNFTNFFLLLGIKYVIINTHGYPGFGQVPNPPFANGFNGTSFNVTGMKYVLNKEGAELVANYSLFLIYKLSSDVKMIYASNGIPFNFSKPHVSEIIFSLYANNTYKVYNISLVSSNITINDLRQGDVNITYKYVNPDYYVVYVNASKEFYLIFDQGYSPDWVLKFSHGTVNENHYYANGYANAWLMPKGSYKVEIYYSPPVPYFQYMEEIYIPLLFSIGALVLIKNKKFIKWRT